MSTHMMRWTALPNGEAGGQPRLSAHAAFHLEPDNGNATLQDFPAALSWPEQDIVFSVTFAAGGNQHTVPATLVGLDPRQPAWWLAVFRPDLVVRGFAPEDRTGWKIRSFSAGRIAAYLRDAYSRLAENYPSTYPPHAELRPFQEIGFSVADRESDALETDKELDDIRKVLIETQRFVPDIPPSSVDPASISRLDFLAFRRFYSRFHTPDPADTGAEPGDRPGRVGWIKPPDLDFHQVVTACFGHATLLRPLGLVFDLVADISMAELVEQIGPAERVRVVGLPGSTPGDAWTNRRSPWTRCDAPWGFYARTRPGNTDLRSRFLRLGDPSRFEPCVFDVDTAALRAMSLGDTLQLVLDKPMVSRSTPNTEPAASLRASGIGIIRKGRAEQFHTTILQRAKALQDQADGTEDLYADDVLRGFRIDVREPDDEWRSLMRRRGAIRLGEAAVQVDVDVNDDEAWVSQVPIGDDEPEQVYLHEEFIRWNGWSLAAPKPGAALDPEDQLDADRDSSDPLPGVPLVAAYQAQPGTLPVQRYGRAYDVRARAVDIAGNSEPLDTVEPGSTSTGPLFFGRFDPVPSPDVLLTEPRKPGERGNVVVLRSHHWDQSPVASESPAARHILPPRGSVSEAERHGELDGPNGRPDPGLYPMLAERDNFSLNQIGIVDPDDPTDDGSGGAEGTSRYYPMATFDVDYLPDPLAKFLELRFREEGATYGKRPLDTPMAFATSSWPEFRALRLEVIEGPPKVTFDDTSGVLSIQLEKAEIIPLRASCRFEPADLNRFGLAAWLAAHLGIVNPDTGPLNPQPEQFEKLGQASPGDDAVGGNHWMFTPWCDLTIVHAVKQPLHAPEMRGVGYNRNLGQTNHQIGFDGAWSVRSTQRLDLLATWTEGIDNGPGTDPPHEQIIEAVAVPDIHRNEEKPLEHEDGVDVALFSLVHEFGDTKHRGLKYRLDATSKFVEYFLETTPVILSQDKVAVVAADDLAAGTVVVRSVPTGDDAPITYRRDDGDGGDFVVVDNGIKRTTDSTIGPNDKVHITYATSPVNRLGEWTDPHDMPCSTRPAAPVIRSVLPTFRWEHDERPEAVTSSRKAAGVRVWLDRPWWSSGLGEKLAVLLTTDGGAPDDNMERFVTQWARDPLHASGIVGPGSTATNPDLPQPHHFPLGTATTDDLTVPGAPSNVRGVVHHVAFDEARDCWYCDIDIDVAGYWPFVRLALARWQPHAVKDAGAELQLSSAVLADIVQTAPGRYVTAIVEDEGLKFSITGNGYAATSDTVGEDGNLQTLPAPIHVDAAPEMVAFVERRPSAAPGDLGWTTIGSEITLWQQPEPAASDPDNLQGHFEWTGFIPLSDILIGSDPFAYEYRLVIEERERYRIDGSRLDFFVADPQHPIITPFPTPGRRVVYTDIISVTTIVLS